MAKIQAIRGMNDLLPGQSGIWQYLETTVKEVLSAYGYSEIRMPILEKTELFKRSIGEVTDIVEKEMYTFLDRNDESVTLRPEGTAGCVRAAEENGLLYNQTQRLWYTGPMFRYERPQKGRYRQFHQIGAECFGFKGPDIDAELIAMTARFWDGLGLADQVKLEINSLGVAEERKQYRAALVDYLQQYKDQLDEDSQRRLQSNPLRILDSKDAQTQKILNDAPMLGDFLGEDSSQHFEQLLALLDNLGIEYEVNQKLVRGLDYYCKTVFEWVTTELGAQGTVCAGGRYDGLVSQLGGRDTPAVGFAMGVERLALLVEKNDVLPETLKNQTDVYIVSAGVGVQAPAMKLAEDIRCETPLRVTVNCGGGSFKAQMKRADKSGAQIALILGEDEIANGTVVLKFLRDDQEQLSLDQDALLDVLIEQSN